MNSWLSISTLAGSLITTFGEAKIFTSTTVSYTFWSFVLGLEDTYKKKRRFCHYNLKNAAIK